MAKGVKAKENLTNLIIAALGDSFAGIADKKIYAWVDDGGEKVQLALSMTMPKTPLNAATPPKNTNDWTEESNPSTGNVVSPIAQNISPEDEEKIQNLMKTLGIVD